MTRLTEHRAIALFLVLWVALAPAYAVFPAAAMTMEMSLSGVVGSDCCDTCPKSELDCEVCAVMCRVAAQAAMAPDAGRLLIPVDGASEHVLPVKPLGQAPPPEPGPPKFVLAL